MEKNQIISSPVKNRFFAFLIDVFFVYLLRFFYINLSLHLWLKRPIFDFFTKYKVLYGDFSFSKMTRIEFSYFLNSDLFRLLTIFVCGIFVIPMIYNAILFSTKWSATIGQKLLGIHVVSSNGDKLNFFQIICRSVLLNIPWAALFFTIITRAMIDYGMIDNIDKMFFIIVLLLFLSWYDLVLLTKNKLVFHDLITLTRVVIKDSSNYQENTSSIWKLIFPDFKGMNDDFKNTIKTQIAKAKEIKAKYKKEKELKKNKTDSGDKVIKLKEKKSEKSSATKRPL